MTSYKNINRIGDVHVKISHSFTWLFSLVHILMLTLLVSNAQTVYSQSSELERCDNLYKSAKKQALKQNDKKQTRVKQQAWECYKLYRCDFPQNIKDRKIYLDELLSGFYSVNDIFDPSLYLPNYSFVDSCLLEPKIDNEVLFNLIAFRAIHQNNDKNIESVFASAKKYNKFTSPVFISLLKSKFSNKGRVIYKYGNDILNAYLSSSIDDISRLIVYQAFTHEAKEDLIRNKYAKLSAPIYEKILSDKYDKEVLAGYDTRNVKRDYLYSVRDIYNTISFDRFTEKSSALVNWLEATKKIKGMDSDDYGYILLQLTQLYQMECTKLGKRLKDVNQDVWTMFTIYNKQYQDWLKSSGQFGSRNYNDAVHQVVFLSHYYRQQQKEALDYFWSYLGQVKDKFGEESQEYLRALREVGQNTIDQKIKDKEITRVRIAALEKDESDEAKRELAELRAKTETQNEKILVLETIKAPDLPQIVQLATNEYQYGNIDGSIKYWKRVLDSCAVFSNRSEEAQRIATSYTSTGLMQLQMIMQSAGYYDNWWAYASNFIRNYNHSGYQYLTYLLMVASSIKGDYASMDYFRNKYNFSLEGDGSKGIMLLDEILPQISGIDKNSETYAHLLATKADLYCFSQDYKKARELYEESVQIIKSLKGESSLIYLQYLMYLEVLSAYEQNYDDAIKRGLAIKELLEKSNNTDCLEYSNLLFRLQMYYDKSGQYDLVIATGKKLAEKDTYLLRPAITPTILMHAQGPQSNLTVYYREQSLLVLANAHFHKKQNKEAYTIVSDVIRNTQQSIEKNYSAFVKTKQKNLMPWVELLYTYTPLYAYRLPQYDWAKQSYDAALLYKQFSLSADNALKQIILKSDDSRLINKLNELIATRQLFDNASEQDMDSLSRRITQLESQLLVDVKRYGDVGEEMKTNWSEVARSLSQNDISIEFTSCWEDDGSCHYMANIIKNGIVKTVYLCSDEDLAKASDYYTTKSGYNLIWLPLEEDFKNAGNIYFSATDRLHQIGIEYFPINASGTLLSEAYQVHRLSSTRELIVKYPKDISSNAALYGGIEYEWDEKNDKDKKNARVMRDVPDVGDTMRGGFSYLPGTKKEIDEIGALLKKEKINVKMHEGMDGTEESLKELSSYPLRMLHIATHGFYNPKGRRTKFDALFKKSIKYSSLEDFSMNRSGLLMAGAGNSISGQPKSGNDDGVLTSKEISSLDFTHLDLAVLSACETALGEISNEGVYGLQRAFKKAGAHTLIMSLKKVDDDATRILMTSFYKNLLTMNKLKAFRLAQKQLRQAEGGKYDKPEYWASFILLDD